MVNTAYYYALRPIDMAASLKELCLRTLTNNPDYIDMAVIPRDLHAGLFAQFEIRGKISFGAHKHYVSTEYALERLCKKYSQKVDGSDYSINNDLYYKYALGENASHWHLDPVNVAIMSAWNIDKYDIYKLMGLAAPSATTDIRSVEGPDPIIMVAELPPYLIHLGITTGAIHGPVYMTPHINNNTRDI